MTALLPDPVPLDPPPGDPCALADLAGRLDRAAALLEDLGRQVAGDAVAAPSWTGRDADAVAGPVGRVRELAAAAAGALLRAGARVSLHADLLADARSRLARLRAAQEEDFGAAALRMGGVVDPAGAGEIDVLRSAESARRRVATAILEEVADDAAATAGVLAACSAVAGGTGGPGDREQASRYLAAVLPGWHELDLERRGREFASAVRSGDEFSREQAARDLLPWADDGHVAASVLTGLGAEGLRDVLRRLGEGSLSAGSALARVTAAVLGAPVPPARADEVARVREGRHVDPGDSRTVASDLVALGMGVVLAAGRTTGRPGPPTSTVREWGRQVVARERALGAERIVDRVRLPGAVAPPGDPLQEVLAHLARADDAAPAPELLRGGPTWEHLLHRPWDDGGAALAAALERAAGQPDGDVVLRSGLRSLASGLGDDGDPAGWSVDRATAAAIAPALAGAVAARPDVVLEPLARAAAGEGPQDRLLLRGLGYLSADPVAAGTLGGGMDRAVATAAGGAPADAARAAAVAGGYLAVREYGQRLAHALDEFAAQEQAERRGRLTDVVGELVSLRPEAGRVLGPAVALIAVTGDLDGTWDASPDTGARFPEEDAGPTAGARSAYREVTTVLGTPTAPTPPPVDWLGLAADLFPGGGRLRDVAELGGDVAADLLDEVRTAHVRAPRTPED